MLDIHNPETLSAALDGLPIGVCLVNLERRISFWSHGAEVITGYLRQDVLGRVCGEVLLIKYLDRSTSCRDFCPLVGAMRDGQPRETRAYLHHRSGYAFPVSLRAVPLRDTHGRVVGAVNSFVERPWSSKRHRLDNTLEVGRGLDALTKLPDSTFTRSYLRERVNFATEHSVAFGVLCIRLEHMDLWKATHGLDAAEAILHVVAQTLRNGLDPLDFVGRWSEDKFLAIISNCNDSDISATAERLKQLAQSSEIMWWGDRLSITAAVDGSVIIPAEPLDVLLTRIRAIPAYVETNASTSAARPLALKGLQDKEN